jgi:hypothetical protein
MDDQLALGHATTPLDLLYGHHLSYCIVAVNFSSLTQGEMDEMADIY